LERVAADLEFAVQRFERMFGEKPPQIAVRVMDSPEAMTAFDTTPVLAGGGHVLMWLSSEYRATTTADVSIAPALGAVLMQGQPPSVVATLPGQGPRGLDLRAKDEILRVQGIGTTTIEALNETLEKLPPGTEVKLVLRRDGGEVECRFTCARAPVPEVKSVRADTSTAPRLARMSPLTHEVGHLFLMTWVDRKCLGIRNRFQPKESGVYGHELVPDWLDEAVATGCEVPALQETRFTRMRSDTARWLPFDSLFAMRHPVAGADWLNEIRKTHGKTLGGKPGQFKMLRATVPTGALDSSSGPFYGQSMAVGLFLAERGGASALPTLACALVRGESIEQVLPRIRGVPGTVAGLESAVREWVGKK